MPKPLVCDEIIILSIYGDLSLNRVVIRKGNSYQHPWLVQAPRRQAARGAREREALWIPWGAFSAFLITNLLWNNDNRHAALQYSGSFEIIMVSFQKKKIIMEEPRSRPTQIQRNTGNQSRLQID
jgi:hypothetical protein